MLLNIVNSDDGTMILCIDKLVQRSNTVSHEARTSNVYQSFLVLEQLRYDHGYVEGSCFSMRLIHRYVYVIVDR